MKYIILFILVSIIISSCDSNIEYNFDSIEHYSYNGVTHSNIRVRDNKANALDSMHDYLIFDVNQFKKVDADIYNNLEKIGFTKTTIKENNHQKIANIYSQNGDQINESNKCSPVYRDILVFKKTDEIIGISRICFECNKHSFISGSLISGNSLEQKGDFNKLKSVLK